MKITVRFLEPFRLSEWIPSDERNPETNKTFKRGLAFARWHKRQADDKGRPFITGSLLRAAVIRAAENLLVLSGGAIKLSDKEPVTCCPGRFFTKEKKNRNGKAMPFRRRSTLQWTKHQDSCDMKSGSVCPLCQLLGNKNGKENVYVNFRNLNLPDKDSYSYDDIQEIALSRIVNRVDYSTGKAHDYFNIFETDHLQFPCFEGEITIADNVSPYAIQLLKDSLRFVDRLCGALCVISFDETEQKRDMPPARPKDITSLIREKADVIIEKFQEGKMPDDSQKDKSERLQLIAAAIREIGRDKAKVFDLPKNHEGKESHYLWDVGKDKDGNGIGVREILKEAANDGQIAAQWRRFCLELGELLYQKAKEKSGGLTPAARILGDAEYISSADPEIDPPVISKGINCETLIIGKLIAKTPFFFGIAGKEKRQTDMTVLLDSQNRYYRIPRSALRGVLRRDLRSVMGTGCNAEIAGEHLCLCPVCLIMKDITILDTRSKTDTQPEVRQRIRINPYTGTVQEKALFNMEVGPEGAKFPFILSYKGKSIPKELKNVLKWWSEGNAFLGGAEATGKSVFELTDIQTLSFDFTDEKAREKYLSTCGWRGFLSGFELNTEDLKNIGWLKTDLNFSEGNYKGFSWQKVPITIKLESPFLNGDPVRALTESESDIVSFMKCTKAGKEWIFAYKAESFRGVVRTALGRRHKEKDITDKLVPIITLPHQDCECLLCKLFGSEHETGKLHFEDLTFESDPKEKTFDHVAIDRFTGGAVDKKKFDDRSLISDNSLILKGCFWYKELSLNDKTNEAKELGKAFKDIKDGFYPLGAKSGTGYGVVTDLIIGNPDNNNDIVQSIIESMNSESFPDKKGSFEKPDSCVNINPSDNAVYYPYYFLKPDESKVKREPIPIGHEEAFKENLLSGKITCRLTTKTPLIIPDTENEDAFGFKETVNKGDDFHKSYHFMTLNNKPVIPGSEIRGMISSVYEAVTNSCFRIFDEKYRLSWRMEADKDVLNKFFPGRVTDDGKKIEEMIEYRFPFYDQNITNKDRQNGYFDQWKATIELTDESIKKLEEENVYQSIRDAIAPLKTHKYKNRETFVSDLKKSIGKIDDYQEIILESLERGKVGLTDKSLKWISKKVPQWFLTPLKTLKNKTYENREKFEFALKAIKGIKDKQFHLILNNIDEDVKLTTLSFKKIEMNGVPQTLIDILTPFKDEIYKNQGAFLSDFKKKMGEIIGFALKHAKSEGDVPRYNHPTPTDRMLLSLAECNRKYGREREKAKYKIIKPKRNLKADFMFAATPSENNLKNYKSACIADGSVDGYLKINGPNKIEKVKDANPNLTSLPTNEQYQIIVHNGIYLRKITVANAKKNKLRERLVPEFACSDGKKEITYSMTKRCERIFVKKDDGETLVINDSAIKEFEILVKEYRANAKQQETPPVFQTILPDNGKLNPGDLVYFRKENGQAVEIIPVRISRKIDETVIGNENRIRQDLRPCHGEWIGDEDLSQLDNYPEKKLFTRNPEGLCPACRLFGTGAYKSRVRFGFATLENEPKWLKPSKEQKERGVTLPLLERPRPTWAIQHNDKENDKVPGRKFYVHHHGWENIKKGIHPVTKDEIKRDVNNRTVEPLDKGNTFTFDIFFENLEPHELGLLLWSLQLEKGLAHKLGMAKSMGFGSVEISLEGVNLRKKAGEWMSQDNTQVGKWIETGKLEVARQLKWNNLPHIKDLKKLLCFHDHHNIRVGYPALEKKMTCRVTSS